jgi:hypothetical protein
MLPFAGRLAVLESGRPFIKVSLKRESRILGRKWNGSLWKCKLRNRPSFSKPNDAREELRVNASLASLLQASCEAMESICSREVARADRL